MIVLLPLKVAERPFGATAITLGMMGVVAILHGRRRMRLALVAMLAASPRVIVFTLPAYAFIAIWLVEQVFFASFGSTTLGVAFGAHLGGFLFGAVAAITYRLTLASPADLDLGTTG